LSNLKTGKRLTGDDVPFAIDAADDDDGGPGSAFSGRPKQELNENLAPSSRVRIGAAGQYPYRINLSK